MPLYDFKCREHGVFTVFYPMDQNTKSAFCKDCGEKCDRYYDGSRTTIVFKGPGFYATDSREQHHE